MENIKKQNIEKDIQNKKASNFKNKFQCFFKREYKKKIAIPEAIVTMT